MPLSPKIGGGAAVAAGNHRERGQPASPRPPRLRFGRFCSNPVLLAEAQIRDVGRITGPLEGALIPPPRDAAASSPIQPPCYPRLRRPWAPCNPARST